jgi:integrase
VKGGKTAANRCTGLLGAIFTYAVRHGMRPDNPVHGLQRFADGKRERRLSEDEYGLLGKAVARASEEAIWPPAVAVVRFLAFTGWRKGEVLGLRWSEVDLARRTATLSDTKTGRSVRPLSQQACDVLQEIAALHPNGAGLVFPATRGDGPMQAFRKFWLRIASLGGLPRAAAQLCEPCR